MLILLAVAALASCEEAPPPSPAAPPPPAPPPTVDNVVLICIDTVGADIFYDESIGDDLSARLPAAQRYGNTLSPAPWTIPSVASTLTGLYPVQHGAGMFPGPVANLAEEVPSALAESAETLADILGRQGFHTEAIAAHPWFRAGFGLEQGFGTVHPRNDRTSIVDRFEVSVHQFLKRRDSAPQNGEGAAPQRFFAYLHFMEAHDWHLEDLPEREARLADVEPGLVDALAAQAGVAACADAASPSCNSNVVYNLAVRRLRESIGEVIAVLERWKLADDTLVIVYSDHGEEFWQHEARHATAGDPRSGSEGFIYGFGHGHSMYQELLHVPLVVWYPGVEGAVHEEPVSLIDVVPSVLSWLNAAPADANLPGMALPLHGFHTPGAGDSRTLFASGIAYGPETVAVRDGAMKSIMQYPGEHYEFYDLESDPGERDPRFDDALVYRFDALTGDYLEMPGMAFAGGPGPQVNAEMLEQLKSIGYLQGVEAPPEAPKQVPPAQGEPTAQSNEKPREP